MRTFLTLSTLLCFIALSAGAQTTTKLPVSLSGQGGNKVLQEQGTPGAISVEQASRLFAIYPNPAGDQLHVDFASRPVGLVSYKVFDLTGRMVKNHQYVALGDTD